LLKNDFFEFFKVHWIHFTGDMNKFVSFWCGIFSGFLAPTIVKVGSFLIELFKK